MIYIYNKVLIIWAFYHIFARNLSTESVRKRFNQHTVTGGTMTVSTIGTFHFARPRFIFSHFGKQDTPDCWVPSKQCLTQCPQLRAILPGLLIVKGVRLDKFSL